MGPEARAVPRRNRVTPFGDLIADPARGTLMGNRGRLHDAEGRIVRDRLGRRWICCLLEFRGRRRPVMTPGRYTELFFLDEATALAAGHRPCFECRRADALRFQACWAAASGSDRAPTADEMDRALDAERLDRGRKRPWWARLGEVPDGAMVAVDGGAMLVLGDALLPWSPAGYGGARRRPSGATKVEVLTPPSISAAIAAAYRPAIHPSADRSTGS
jgi:hypothetical protein